MSEMKVIIEGVCISLTPSQINAITKERKRREKCRSSFEKMLVHFGFTGVPDLPNSFEHKACDWYAEITDRGGWSDVWMVGHGLRQGRFPGGWIYDDPEEIEKEIIRALEQTDFTKH
ncbi:MAG TPA: hypothetical protein VGN00_14170 [Puia sp.]|jgi:hypothetical protein